MKTLNRGLTLLEMLVVLTLVSMLTTVLFQGYGYMLLTYQRIQLRQTVEFKRALANTWFRGSMENLVAYDKVSQRFSAIATTITGATFSPLLAQAGIPTPIRWELRNSNDGLQLHYFEGDPEREQTLLITTWAPGTSAEFRFRSAEGKWQEQCIAGEDGQIPSAIQLQTGVTEGLATPPVTAVIQTRLHQYISAEEIYFGRDE